MNKAAAFGRRCLVGQMPSTIGGYQARLQGSAGGRRLVRNEEFLFVGALRQLCPRGKATKLPPIKAKQQC
jgi:hypothetical protein